MYRINHSSAEADKFGAGKDGWTNGDPNDPGSGTVPQAAFLDGVQEELIGIIEAAGLTPTNADYTQLVQALLLKIGGTMTGTLGFNISGDDETARISEGALDSVTNLRLLYQSGWVRLYADFTGLFVSYNCTYSNTTNVWTSDAGPTAPSVIELNPTNNGVSLHRGTLTAGVFAEQSRLDLAKTVNAAPGPDVSFAVGISKVVGRIDTVGGVATAVSGSLGIDTTPIGSGLVQINFDNNFNSLNYFVQITGAEALNYTFNAEAVNVGFCLVECRDADSGLAINMGGNDVSFYVDIKGTHA